MSYLAFATDDLGKSRRSTPRAQVPERSWLTTGETPSFKVTPDSIKSDADQTAKMWMSHPAYRMTLTSMQKQFDTDGDGIERDEFAEMLKAAGSKASAEALFASLDADGDGVRQLVSSLVSLLSMSSDLYNTLRHASHALPTFTRLLATNSSPSPRTTRSQANLQRRRSRLSAKVVDDEHKLCVRSCTDVIWYYQSFAHVRMLTLVLICGGRCVHADRRLQIRATSSRSEARRDDAM